MNCLLLKSGSEEVFSGSEELLTRWQSEQDTLIWIEFAGPINENQEELLERYLNLHPLGLQDAKRDRHPPKLEVFEDSTLILFKELTRETEDIDFSTIQLAMFTGERFLVTRTSGPSRSIARVVREVKKDPEHFMEDSGIIAARLIRLVIDRFLTVLLALEPKLEEFEDELMDRFGDRELAELTGYKTDLKRMRRIFLYQVQMLDNLRKKPCPGFPADRRHELTDIFEQQERANSLTQLYYELATDLIDGFLSLSSHRLNSIMKVLTIITAVFVPLSFLAGIYGMNFENMPELQSKFGYFTLLAVMAMIATTLLYVFRKRDWL